MRVRFPSRRQGAYIELEGELHLPQGEGLFKGVVLCHPHPAGGGSMGVGLIAMLADSLCSSGMAVLRFNFGGVGTSEGPFTGGEEEPTDVLAAFDHLASLEEVDSGRVGVAGWSFGSWMGLMAIAGGLGAVTHVAVAPPLIVCDWRREATKIAASGATRYYLVGDRDQFCPVSTLREFAASVGEEDERNITVIGEADHFLFGREPEVLARVGHILESEM